MLRGLHSTTPISAIKSGLEEIGHNVRNVTCVLHPTEKYPLPLFFIDLEPAQNNPEIFQVKRLVYSTVRIEEPRQRPIIVQCTKCQNLGHTKTYCNHQARCVKCAGPHASDTCPRPREEDAKCALCGEAHPASYRGCVVYKTLLKQKTQYLTLKNRQQSTHTDIQPPALENSAIFPELPAIITPAQQPTTSKAATSYDHQQDTRKQYSTVTTKAQQPRRQAPQVSHPKTQTSQSYFKTSNPQSQAPRQQIPPYHQPLKVKLPPETQHPVPSHTPTVVMNPPLEVPLKIEVPRRAQPPIRTPSRINYPPQDPDPIHHHPDPNNINSILQSFLIDLQSIIKPLITLLTRILSEMPFNFPR